MLEVIKNWYWNIPQWGRLAIVIWLTMMSFKSYLKSLYSKKDFTAASFYIILFVILVYSMCNSLGSDFNLISGGY